MKKTDQKLLKEIDDIQSAFHGKDPDAINMFYASRLHSLTKYLIGLTIALCVLTAGLIYLTWRLIP